MAKAQFHKNQRVYVKPVGTWALIEHVVPHWAKGIEEPIRIHYDVGLGREFAAEELLSEEPVNDRDTGSESWRVVRARNKWQPVQDCTRHPVPGTYPVVVTGDADWGGWRVPGAEYDRDPQLIETQARLLVAAPRLLKLAKDIEAFIAEAPEDAPAELQDLAKRAGAIVRQVTSAPATKADKAQV